MIATDKAVGFTPGPWERIPQKPGGDLIAQRFETGDQMSPTGLHLIAFMQSRGSSLAMDNDNANLIAAAPELYEALKKALQQIKNYGGDGLASGADAALAKAEGRKG